MMDQLLLVGYRDHSYILHVPSICKYCSIVYTAFSLCCSKTVVKMAATPASIRALAKAAPMDDLKARQEIYNAARELMFAVEPAGETDTRLYFSVSQLPPDHEQP